MCGIALGKGSIVNTNILTTLCAFLRTAPAMQGIALTAEQLPPAPFTAGLWGKGTAVKETRQNLWGETRQSRRSEFVLRLCLPLPPGDDDAALQNAQRLEALQAWLAAQSAAHTAPTFGNYETETEALRTADACMERTDAGGTACYTLRLWADYTVAYTEKGELV